MDVPEICACAGAFAAPHVDWIAASLSPNPPQISSHRKCHRSSAAQLEGEARFGFVVEFFTDTERREGLADFVLVVGRHSVLFCHRAICGNISDVKEKFSDVSNIILENFVSRMP